MTKREQRAVEAFVNCVCRGEFTEGYAITLVEDDARYGWMSNTAKDTFYAALDALHAPETKPASEEDAEQPLCGESENA